jgi:hypothetical protein
MFTPKKKSSISSLWKLNFWPKIYLSDWERALNNDSQFPNEILNPLVETDVPGRSVMQTDGQTNLSYSTDKRIVFYWNCVIRKPDWTENNANCLNSIYHCIHDWYTLLRNVANNND